MSEIIMGQVRFVLVTLCLGMALMLGYDVFRFLRWLIPHHKAAVGIEDILYWSVVSVPAYAVFFIYNNGEIRWYGVLAVFLGAVIYEKGISQEVRRLGRRYLEKPKRKIINIIVKSAGRLKRKKKPQKNPNEYRKKEKKTLQKSVK